MALTPEKRSDELQRMRDNLSDTVTDCIKQGGNWLIEALMALGKTYTAGTVVSEVDEQITVYTKLWDTREQIKQYAIEHTDLTEDDIKILPTLDRHCGSFEIDEDGDPVYPTVYEKLNTARNQGATASVIHESETHLPCTEDGDCEYNKKISFDPEAYDLIIGSPQHAHIDTYNEDRVVLIDEDAADSYEEEINATQINKSVNFWFQSCEEFDRYVEDHDDISVGSKSEMQDLGIRAKGKLLDFIESETVDIFDPDLAVNTSGGRADSAAIIRALLEYEKLEESGFERAQFYGDEGGQITTVRDTQNGESMTIRRPPKLKGANAVLALDGTPCHEMWENRLNRDLEHVEVLDKEEKQYYISEVLNYNIYQTSTSMHPFSSGEHVKGSERQMFALIEAVSKDYDQKVPLVTTKNARNHLKEDKPNYYDEFIKDDRLYYNSLRSHSEYEDYGLQLVLGCKFPGDREIQRLGALDGHDFGERPNYIDRDPDVVGGSFPGEGDKYYRHSCHNSTAQAIFRPGRGDNADGADIFVHTAMMPDWIPVDATIDEKVRVRGQNEREVMHALMDLQMAHTATIEDMVNCCGNTIRRHLDNEMADGYVESEWDRGKKLWTDNGLKEANWWGEVHLPNKQ